MEMLDPLASSEPGALGARSGWPACRTGAAELGREGAAVKRDRTLVPLYGVHMDEHVLAQGLQQCLELEAGEAAHQAVADSAAGRKTLLKALRENVLVVEGDAEDFLLSELGFLMAQQVDLGAGATTWELASDLWREARNLKPAGEKLDARRVTLHAPGTVKLMARPESAIPLLQKSSRRMLDPAFEGDGEDENRDAVSLVSASEMSASESGSITFRSSRSSPPIEPPMLSGNRISKHGSADNGHEKTAVRTTAIKKAWVFLLLWT